MELGESGRILAIERRDGCRRQYCRRRRDGILMDAIEQAIGRHERIALQLSGGRDSLACLYLLRPFWDRLTVYWFNTGDPFPETEQAMELVRAEVPHFVEIDGHQPDVVAQYGIPSDIVPASRTPIGIAGSGGPGPMIQDRYACCARVFMVPMHERMRADGITLIIRGQRADDRLKAPICSGHVEDGVEYLFPIEEWSVADVMDYLRKNRLPVPRFYQMMDSAPDCMTCSAYWENGVSAYLKQYHPSAYAIVQQRLDMINEAVREHIAAFNIEVNS
jgi:phosphoadenosine phosphosulfate reductase